MVLMSKIVRASNPTWQALMRGKKKDKDFGYIYINNLEVNWF